MVRGYRGEEAPWQRKPLPPIPGVLSAISWVTGEEFPTTNFKPVFRVVFPQGAMLYHGTSPEAAQAIVRDGFHPPGGGPVWFSSSFHEALEYGRRKSHELGERDIVAVIEAYITPSEASGCLVSFHYPHIRVHCPAGKPIFPHEMRAFVEVGRAKGYQILERKQAKR